MKKILLYVAFLVALLHSCKEDLGNYEYTEVNALAIQKIEGTYLISNGSSPNIFPELAFSKDPNYNEENYTFEWVTFKLNVTSDEQRQTVHRGKNFDVPFPLGLGSYNTYYIVKEKSTGLRWQKKFFIKVEGNYRGGWAVLSAVNKSSRVDYFEYDHSTGLYPKSYRDFTSMFADEATGRLLSLHGEPKFIQGWSVRTPSTGTAAKYQLYMGAENTEKINVTDGFNWKESYSFVFESSGGQALRSIDKLYPVRPGEGYAYKDGNAYLTYNVFQYTFGTPINRLPNGNTFPISEYIAVNRISTNVIGLMYDTLNKRFVRVTGGNQTATTPLPYNAASAAFDPNNVGKDLVWMGATDFSGVYAFAVLKEGSKYFLARIQNGNTFVAQYMDEITSLPGIAEAKYFAVDQLYGYLQYAVGGKLYQYDAGETKKAYLMKDFGEREITMLKYDQGVSSALSTAQNPANANTYGKRFLPALTSLICATYDAKNPDTSGKVEFFKVPQFNAEYSVNYSFDGFGKVKDVCNVETPLGW